MQSSTSPRQDSSTPPGSCDLDTLAAVLAELREEMRATREAMRSAANEREIVVSLIHEHGYHQAVQDFHPQVGRARRRVGRLVPRPSHIRAVDGRSS